MKIKYYINEFVFNTSVSSYSNIFIKIINMIFFERNGFYLLLYHITNNPFYHILYKILNKQYYVFSHKLYPLLRFIILSNLCSLQYKYSFSL